MGQRPHAGEDVVIIGGFLYALIIDLPPAPGGELHELIAPLQRDGTAPNIEPVLPKTRAIDEAVRYDLKGFFYIPSPHAKRTML